ncbi:MAG: DinB family protein [Flavobacteriales bacterium]|nr:DinB family protein [Flavobacteriales bacterium]
MNDQQGLFVKMAIDAWSGEVKATNALLDKLTDEQLMNEVAPGRNRGIYLLGHLTAVHDRMMPLLRFQDALHPELDKPFHDEADRVVAELPSIAQLRAQWKEVNDTLLDHMKRLPATEWFTRHASVSEEDFAKEPHRNRLNVVLSRTSHLAYHRGQLVLLASRE